MTSKLYFMIQRLICHFQKWIKVKSFKGKLHFPNHLFKNHIFLGQLAAHGQLELRSFLSVHWGHIIM
uniref:Uncharacterized protein n=1 Tax=Anguilla anguilla TaxID=7936 RepID=A0A0E9QSB5_ANGAN